MCSEAPLGHGGTNSALGKTSLETLKTGLLHNRVVITSSHLLSPHPLPQRGQEDSNGSVTLHHHPLKGELNNNQKAHLRTQARDKEKRGRRTANL